MIRSTHLLFLMAILCCVPSLLKAQQCNPTEIPVNPEYHVTCTERLTTSSYSSGGMSHFELVDDLGGGGIDFEWLRTSQSCLYIGMGSTLSVPSDGNSYMCIAKISGQACNFYFFTATAPTPPPVPVPVTTDVVACTAGQTTLSIQPMSGSSFEWRESSTGQLLQSQGYLTTGEYYVLQSLLELTIYHGAGPLSYNFMVSNVKNGVSSSAHISLSVLAPLPPITSQGPLKICTTCSQTLTAHYDPNATYQWRRNGSPISPPETTHELTTSQAGSYAVIVQADGCSWTSNSLLLTINTPPVADAGEDLYNYYPNMAATGHGTDADGEITALYWTQISGPPVTINNPSSSTMVVTAPPVGTYVFRLTVTDDNGDTGYDDVTIYKRPESEICYAPLANDCAPHTFTTSQSPICSSSPTQFTFNVEEVNPYGGLIYTWYKITASGCELMEGDDNSFTTPVIAEGVGESYRCLISIGASDCYSFDFHASVSPPPSAIPVVDPSVYACSSGESYLEIIPDPGFTYTWSEPTMGTIEPDEMVSLPGGLGYVQLDGPKLKIVHSGEQQSLNFTVNGVQSGAQCQIPRQALLSFTVVENQVADIIEASDQSRCGPGTVTLSASGTQLSGFEWYSPLTVLWQPGAEVESEHLSASKSYFVRATDQYGCNDYKEVKVEIKDLPQQPIVEDVELCAWEPLRITPQNGGLINWYVHNSSEILQTSAILQLDPLKTTGQFVYEAEGIATSGCVGLSKTSFTVIVPDNCDERLNWIHTKAFDTDGLTGESRVYFNDAGQLIQNQTKNFSNERIFANQPLRDRYNRIAANTLTAPLAYNEFKYNFKYVTNTSDAPYSYLEFDAPQKVLNADPVDNDVSGTLGWYFSANNTWEDHVPVTQYPYTRTDFYNDGTGEVRRAASQGEHHRLGSGHEVLSGTFPVFSELNDYLEKRIIAMPGIVQDGRLVNEGVQYVSRDQNGRYSVSISDKSGNLVMSCRPGTLEDHVLSISVTVKCSGDPSAENYPFLPGYDPDLPTYRPMTYFYILHDQPVTISGGSDFVAENILTDEKKDAGVTFADANGNWPAGFYRILLNNSASQVTITYTNYFLDVAYQFYDDAGRLKVSLSPNGYSQLVANGGAMYAVDGSPVIDVTCYQYNHQGWLLSTTEPDAGKTQYVYRKDGKIRFSQNAEQENNNRFSYTHYDKVGRPVESGEYIGTGLTFVPMNSPSFPSSLMEGQLEMKYDEINWGASDRKDWVKTYYDNPDTEIVPLPAGFQQDFVRGAVSWTENNNIKTWYSYDELGRVTWMAQKPAALSRAFLTEYKYDFLGNVLEVVNASCENGSRLFPFYHHYEYDADKRLSKVYTSVDGTTQKLRATYEYYLHGPLKRIELGDQIQGIDFVYNIHGWLTQINHPDKVQDPGGDTNDAFGMVLEYYESALIDLFQNSMFSDPMDPARYHKLVDPEKHSDASLAYTSRPPLWIDEHGWRNSIKAMIKGDHEEFK